jgi:hypothetical protein
MVGEAEGGHLAQRGRSTFTAVETKPSLGAPTESPIQTAAVMTPDAPLYMVAVGARRCASGLRGFRSVSVDLREGSDGRLFAEVSEMGPLETLADADRRSASMLKRALTPRPMRLPRE